MDFCTPCCLGKIHRLPSTLSHTNYSSPFDLLFADVWGPAPMDSSCGYRYLLTCVDAYTRYTWVFLIKLKSDVCLTFTHFITAIEVQFSTHIKAVQTDGGGEFKSLTPLFHSKGIAHRLACPHTHTIKMDRLRGSTGMLLKQGSLYLLKQIYPSNSGNMPASLLPT